jgi:hypothetical protein
MRGDTLLRYTLDELSLLIGFHAGAAALHRAGYTTIGAIARATSDELRSVRGIGPWRLQRIQEYLKGLGAELPQRPSAVDGEIVEFGLSSGAGGRLVGDERHPRTGRQEVSLAHQ